MKIEELGPVSVREMAKTLGTISLQSCTVRSMTPLSSTAALLVVPNFKIPYIDDLQIIVVY